MRACFEAYEQALLANDVDAMDTWFWDDPAVVRFGIAECQYGPDGDRGLAPHHRTRCPPIAVTCAPRSSPTATTSRW